MAEIKKQLKEEILKRIDYVEEISDEQILELIDEIILNQSRKQYLGIKEKQRLRIELFNGIRRLDMLQELVDNPEITEIMINGWNHIFVEIDGSMEEWKGHFEAKEKLEDVIQQMVSKSNRVVNEASPIVDARLEDGSRVHVVLSPVALDGPAVTIRKFPIEAITMEDLVQWEAISKEAADLLKKLVQAQYNIFISGGTGAGKTTLLNVLSNFIPRSERVITIEDSAELQIQGIPNLVRLETRESTIEGSKRISMENLIKAALRMRPTRIIIGEVRDSEATINLLQALNTGHSSLSTGHANGVKDMLGRLETLTIMGANMPLFAARRQISSAIDIVVHLGRLRDKSRRVLEIAEVLECDGEEFVLNSLYRFRELEEREDGRIQGILESTGNELINRVKLQMSGIAWEGND